MKRGKTGCIENQSQLKMRRREGLKRGLRDTLPVSYEEYDVSWDHENQSKKCRNQVNCLLVPCSCDDNVARNRPMREKLEYDVTRMDKTGAERSPKGDSRGRRDVTGPSANNTAAKSLQDTVSVSQLYGKPRMKYKS